MLKKVDTGWHSYRLFDLLILAPELLGLVDPMTFVLWKSLQVQLQTASAEVRARYLNRRLHKQAETKLQASVSTKEGLRAARTAVFSAAEKNYHSHVKSSPIGHLDLFGSYLPAYAPKAAAPQSTVDACLPDPGQVITVEEQVVPFFPARGKRGRGRGDL